MTRGCEPEIREKVIITAGDSECDYRGGEAWHFEISVVLTIQIAERRLSPACSDRELPMSEEEVGFK